jgi:hypothetical protein
MRSWRKRRPLSSLAFVVALRLARLLFVKISFQMHTWYECQGSLKKILSWYILNIVKKLENKRVAIVSQDSFYCSLPEEVTKEVSKHNFDHPGLQEGREEEWKREVKKGREGKYDKVF